MAKIGNNRIGRLIALSFILTFVIFIPSGFGAEQTLPKVGPMRINPHPAALEGKTVLLRWNGKYNGDKFLFRVGELLEEQVKNAKIIKMWEVDPSTAIISKKAEVSDQIAAKIATLKPDIVIAAQAD